MPESRDILYADLADVHVGIRQTNYKQSYWMVLHPQKPNEVDRCIISELDYICNHKKSLPENFHAKFPSSYKITSFKILCKTSWLGYKLWVQ